MASIQSGLPPAFARPKLGALAKLAMPSELEAQGLADGGLHSMGKLANHAYQSYAHIQPARAAIAQVPQSLVGSGGVGAALAGVGRVIGRAGILSGAISGVMSLVVHGLRFSRKEETGARAAKMIAVDTTAGLAGGMGAALLSGTATALVGALGLAGLPLTVVGLVAGFIGFSWGDNWVRSKVFGWLDYLHDKQTTKPQATPPQPAV